MKLNKVINVERQSCNWVLEGFNKKIIYISNKYISGSRFKVRRRDL